MRVQSFLLYLPYLVSSEDRAVPSEDRCVPVPKFPPPPPPPSIRGSWECGWQLL